MSRSKSQSTIPVPALDRVIAQSVQLTNDLKVLRTEIKTFVPNPLSRDYDIVINRLYLCLDQTRMVIDNLRDMSEKFRAESNKTLAGISKTEEAQA